MSLTFEGFFANLDSEINTVERNVAHARQEVERATGSLQQSWSKRDDMQAKIATRNSRLAALSAPDQMQGRQQLQSELDQLKAQLDETIKLIADQEKALQQLETSKEEQEEAGQRRIEREHSLALVEVRAMCRAIVDRPVRYLFAAQLQTSRNGGSRRTTSRPWRTRM